MKKWGLLFLTLSYNLKAWVLVDRVCANTNHGSILLSDIEKRAKQKNINKDQALTDLLQEKGLFIYAKNHLKFNIKDIENSAKEHISNIIKNNEFSMEKFEEILSKEPYETDIITFKKQTEFMILKNQMTSHFASQITVSDEQLSKAQKEHKDGYQIVFISFDQKKYPKKLITQTANNLLKLISLQKSLDEIKRVYYNDSMVSFSDTMNYCDGCLKEFYEKKIKNSKNDVTELFLDGDALTLIWKIKKDKQNHKLDGTALENLKKQLYEKAIEEKLLEISKIPQDQYRLNNCGISPQF